MSRPPLLAVCLPSYAEEETVGPVARTVAEGLERLGGRVRPLIVHVDCGSPDRTAARFRALRLPVPALQRVAPRGKGNALRTFFAVCGQEGARFALSFDTDLTAVTPRWVAAFADPLLDGTAQAVLPAYPRSAYEASATHHLALPAVFARTGRLVPQPIGGEFGLDLDVVDPAGLDWSGSTLRFGVDIALTFRMLERARTVALAAPGVKRHKPSFFHLSEVFAEVAETTLRLAAAGPVTAAAEVPGGDGPALWPGSWAHRAASRALFERARTGLLRQGQSVPAWADPALPGWAAERWVRSLSAALADAGLPGADPAAAARALTPLFVVRATSFWLAAERGGLPAARTALLDQAYALRRTAHPAPTV
ncbi:hypothetical protein [Streptomyces sp. NPDC003717]|uniref:hypothetical protein n=1 Tax=Streptomyces sp. NPDC003717 TaxID=3154276 RepID=UPI0033A607C9